MPSSEYPPLDVGSFEREVENKDFDATCYRRFMELEHVIKYELLKSNSTIDQEFGLIWRADFLAHGRDGVTFNKRIVMWRGSNDTNLRVIEAFSELTKPL